MGASQFLHDHQGFGCPLCLCVAAVSDGNINIDWLSLSVAGGGGGELTIRVFSEEQQGLHKSPAWTIRGKQSLFPSLSEDRGKGPMASWETACQDGAVLPALYMLPTLLWLGMRCKLGLNNGIIRKEAAGGDSLRLGTQTQWQEHVRVLLALYFLERSL